MICQIFKSPHNFLPHNEILEGNPRLDEQKITRLNKMKGHRKNLKLRSEKTSRHQVQRQEVRKNPYLQLARSKSYSQLFTFLPPAESHPLKILAPLVPTKLLSIMTIQAQNEDHPKRKCLELNQFEVQQIYSE
ncbi:hypothetical protein ACH5RR_026161 [Cinchona calisaya]|uniref:Uncharacterized protein n=1 Tax=Cinchona calisaya TaxID=153742 RepID=A0ABD2Z3Y3_9GENT